MGKSLCCKKTTALEINWLMSYFKNKRIVNLDLLNVVRKLSCLACGNWPCDPHHVKSKGAGGDDISENLMPLCRMHHVEIHSIGKISMSEKYPVISYWLDAAELQKQSKKTHTK